ncbi:glutamyl-tRNA reductase [Engelhardtia mirabilis]|uniref:glutamyl-tRNA reductase n=1 Tax=Engelhardtia mirabilis TaxID=2528011 RepID=UPI003AF3F3D9
MSRPLDRQLLLVGLSHRSAPLELRERCAVAGEALGQRLTSLLALEGVAEAVIVSTCNRTELLLFGKLDERTLTAVQDLFFHGATGDQVYSFSGVQAVIHLFRVASGLDSLVLGESQILAQLKAASAAAREAGTLGSQIDVLLRAALSVGKRVRNETDLGSGTLSVARVGVDIAAHICGDFRRERALIVGAGETGLLVAKHLRERELGDLVFANRSQDRAQNAAKELGGLHCGLDALPEQIARADLVFVCVDGGGHVITREMVAATRPKRRDRPLLIVDLSVPRGVEPKVAELRGLLYYDLDDLAAVVEKNRLERQRASDATSNILVAEVHKFLSLRSYAAAAPAIAQMRERFELVRDAVIDESVGETSTPEQMRLAHELTRRLLDVALGQVKESIRHVRSAEDLESEYRRFLDQL